MASGLGLISSSMRVDGRKDIQLAMSAWSILPSNTQTHSLNNVSLKLLFKGKKDLKLTVDTKRATSKKYICNLSQDQFFIEMVDTKQY